MVRLRSGEASTPRTYHWRADPFLPWRVATHAALLLAAAVAWWVVAGAPGVGSNGAATTSGEGAMGSMAPTEHGMDGGADAGMVAGTGTGSLVLFLATWVVMMAAMMFPSVAPMVATFVSVQRGRVARQMPAARGGTVLFVAGYLLAWSAIGLAAAALPVVGDLAYPMFWHDNARWLVAGILTAAAVYEVTPWKQACLRKCRGPMAFVVHSWRNGHRGALRMGLEHGAWCVGCCWALMAGLVALGLMSVPWMALIALFIALEKLLPWRRVGTGMVTAALLALAAGAALTPGLVGPGM